jgi:Ca2+-binding EF-hand superfamily protein
MKRYLPSTLAAISLGLVAMGAMAQPGPGIMRFDADGDGSVSREEFQPPEERRGQGLFDRADGNGDGVVTREEVESSVAEQAEERRRQMSERMLARFDSMDADGDGKLTRAEATEHAFTRVDADGDGYITEDEARAMHRRAMGHGRDGKGPKGDKGRWGGSAEED